MPFFLLKPIYSLKNLLKQSDITAKNTTVHSAGRKPLFNTRSQQGAESRRIHVPTLSDDQQFTSVGAETSPST